MGLWVKGVIRYDGTNFAGWQVQPNQRTIQGEIETALEHMMSQPVRVQGAGRTDAGVHALGQVVSFQLPTDYDIERLQRSLNGMLGPDIRFDRIDVVSPKFHPRYDAQWKTYAYSFQFAREPDPFSARYTWCLRWPLDLDLMMRVAQKVIGEHDFAAFQCAGAASTTTIREIYGIELKSGAAIGPMDAKDHWRLEFAGNGFLYKMVRNLTGTLVDIARGKLPESRIEELLRSPGPFHGYTAPSHGLTLVRIEYDKHVSKNSSPCS